MRIEPKAVTLQAEPGATRRLRRSATTHLAAWARRAPVALLPAALLAFATSSQVSPHDWSRLDAVLDSIRTAIGATGAAAAVIDARGTLWVGASGEAWTGEPVTARTVFDVGSITKAYTAALILRLADEGRLAIDDTAGRWLTNLPNGQGVTLRQLLQHTSGLADYTAHPGFMPAIRQGMGGPWPPEANLRFVGPPVFPPDSAWRYSNTNYVLLGLIAAHAGGRSYAELLHRLVLEPLALSETYVAGEDSIAAARAHAYLDFTGDGKPDDLSALVPDPAMTRGAGGAGAIVASAGDVARFARAYFTGRLASPALHAEATRWRDRGDGWAYGFGIIANPQPGDTLLGHLGNTAGQSAGVWHSTRHGITAVLLTNVHGARMATPVERLLRAAVAVTGAR